MELKNQEQLNGAFRKAQPVPYGEHLVFWKVMESTPTLLLYPKVLQHLQV